MEPRDAITPHSESAGPDTRERRSIVHGASLPAAAGPDKMPVLTCRSVVMPVPIGGEGPIREVEYTCADAQMERMRREQTETVAALVGACAVAVMAVGLAALVVVAVKILAVLLR